MMKFIAIIMIVTLLLSLCACTADQPAADIADVPDEFPDAQSVVDFLKEQNEAYLDADNNAGDISVELRSHTATHGQEPYAVIITCSDSRVPAEHIFHAGIGELFVIRTAGNVIGEYELGSVEYGAEHLGAKLVLVLGHTQCGAVEAAMAGGAHGNIAKITEEISSHLPAGCDAREAEIANVHNSIDRIMESEMMQQLVEEGKVSVRGAIYDISTGHVDFME